MSTRLDKYILLIKRNYTVEVEVKKETTKGKKEKLEEKAKTKTTKHSYKHTPTTYKENLITIITRAYYKRAAR